MCPTMAASGLYGNTEYGGIFWRQRGEVVHSFVRTSRQACSGHIVAQDSTVHNLGKERGARDEVAQHVWYIFLPFGSKCLLIARTTTERDYDNFPIVRKTGGST